MLVFVKSKCAVYHFEYSLNPMFQALSVDEELVAVPRKKCDLEARLYTAKVDAAKLNARVKEITTPVVCSCCILS